MGRSCIICKNNLSTFVRQKSHEGKQPSTIIKAIKDKYEIDVKYYQLRYHMQHHDEQSGTYVMAKRGAEKKLMEATEIKDKAVEMSQNIHEFFDKAWGMVNGINWEEFELLPLEKQMKVMAGFQKTMASFKTIEMKQQALDNDRNPGLKDVMKLMSRSKREKE